MKAPRTRFHSATVCLLASAFLAISACSPTRSDLQAEGDALVQQVEEFKKRNSRLPESLGELGLKEDESGPVYYAKTDSSSYMVWYGTTLGSSRTWDSKVGVWK